MASAPPPNSSSGSAAHTAAGADGRLRVLCVDDNVDFARLFANILAYEDDMMSAGTLTNADTLEADVERLGATVVLLDLSMPGRDSWEAIKGLVAQRPQVRIIAFSGYDDEETCQRAVAAGCKGLISKSVDPVSVVATIRALCRT